MSFYLTDKKTPTTGIRNSRLDDAFFALKRTLDSFPFAYAWVEKAKKADSIGAFLGIHGITIEDDGCISRLRFDEVYESDFFADMFDAIAPYVSDGVMLLNREGYTMAVQYQQGEYHYWYGRKAHEVYEQSLKERENERADDDFCL